MVLTDPDGTSMPFSKTIVVPFVPMNGAALTWAVDGKPFVYRVGDVAYDVDAECFVSRRVKAGTLGAERFEAKVDRLRSAGFALEGALEHAEMMATSAT